MDTQNPTVFISYSHDSQEHIDRVLAFSDRLRSDGIDTILDQYETAPPRGWPQWMERHVRTANFVLVVCTSLYLRRSRGEEEPGVGQGIRWESLLTTQHLYDAGSQNTRFIPVLLAGSTKDDIPTPLRPFSSYEISTEDGYTKLLRRLTNQPETIKPELGPIPSLPPLPPRERKDNFLRAPILPYLDLNLKLWRDSQDKSALHLELTWLANTTDSEAGKPSTWQHYLEHFPEIADRVDADIGKTLYDIAFTKEWRARLQDAIDTCKSAQTGLRLNICTNDEKIAAHPWECIYPLAMAETSLCAPRYMILRGPVDRSPKQSVVQLEDSAHVLIVSADDDDTIEERKVIEQYLKPLASERTIEFASIPSWEYLQEELYRVRPHLLHLAVPGTERTLHLAQANKLETPFDDLYTAISECPDLKIVVINVYQANEDEHDPALRRQCFSHCVLPPKQLVALVVTRLPVSPRISRQFSRVFYTALAAGHCLTFASGLARLSVANLEPSEWSHFMTYETCEVIPFPPLVYPPRWANIPDPDPQQVLGLFEESSEIEQDLARIYESVATSKKLCNRLLTLEEALKIFEIPSATWKDTALYYARSARENSEECYQKLRQARTYPPSTARHKSHLQYAYQASEQAQLHARQLTTHLQKLVLQLWHSQEHSMVE